jgi:hypothetical protein
MSGCASNGGPRGDRPCFVDPIDPHNPFHLYARSDRCPLGNTTLLRYQSAMTTNPSHILIARNSRGQSNITTASLSSPTETHAAAAGIFRSSAGSPPWFLEGVDTEDAVSEASISDSREPIDIDEAFTKNSKFPGTVKIVVESTTFWCVWASPIYTHRVNSLITGPA